MLCHAPVLLIQQQLLISSLQASTTNLHPEHIPWKAHIYLCWQSTGGSFHVTLQKPDGATFSIHNGDNDRQAMKTLHYAMVLISDHGSWNDVRASHLSRECILAGNVNGP